MGLPILFRAPAPAPAITGTAESSFAATVAATGLERFVGSGASAFGARVAAAGREVFTATAASSFGFAPAVAGLERFQAAGGSTFGAVGAAAAEERFAGDVASSFGFSAAASGRSSVAAPPPSPTTTGRGARFVPPRRPRRTRITAAGASAFGIRLDARGRLLEQQLVVGQGASVLAFTAAGSATLDFEPLRIALEDEAWLLGIDDQELVPTS